MCVRLVQCLFLFWQTAKKWTSYARCVLVWIANWATTLSTHPDTMEIARTGRRQLEHKVACFILKRAAVCVCVQMPVLDEASASLMNTMLADARLCQVGEPKERCSAPAEKRCSLICLLISLCVSDLLFPPLFSYFLNALQSFFLITFLHFSPTPPPSLPIASRHSILPFILRKWGARLMSLCLQGALSLCVPYKWLLTAMGIACNYHQMYTFRREFCTFPVVNLVTVHLPDNVDLSLWCCDFHYKNCMGVKH